MPKPPAAPIEPVNPATEPKKAEAIARGGHKPAGNPDAGTPPLSEPYGKAATAPAPKNPARKKA